jgi:hypothetical protein
MIDTKRLDWLEHNPTSVGLAPEWIGESVQRGQKFEYLNVRKLIDEAMKCQGGETVKISRDEMPCEFTYVSKQATTCAVCGKVKHTPLRNDAMGGYVCLTCIDRELARLQSEQKENECL